MSSLDELEDRLAPQLRRALSEVMPRLETPTGTVGVAADHAADGEHVQIDGTPRRPGHGTRWLLIASGIVGLVGGTWWVRSVQEDSSITPADAPAVAPDSTVTPDDDPASPTTSVGGYPLDGLDPLSAARQLTLGPRIGPTPEEYADLAAAQEILRRDCLRDGGATPPAVTSNEHVAVRDGSIESLKQRSRLYTTDGLAALRTEGFFPDDPLSPTELDGAPLHLTVAEGSLEFQLIVGGCRRAGDDLEPGPVGRQLGDLVPLEIDGVETGSRWADIALNPENLPEFADEFPALKDCMADAGYPNHFDDVGSPLWVEFMATPGVSDEELELANAFADCYIATNLPTTYVEAVSGVLDEFDRGYASELEALRVERDTALELARSVLIDHGIDPFTG